MAWLKTIQTLLLPKTPQGWIFLFIGATSILSLIVYGTGYTLDPIVHVIISAYESILEDTLGLAEPWIKAVLLALANILEIKIELQGHWKHIFVLICIYFFKDAENAWKAGRRTAAYFHAPLGFIISCVCALAVGSIKAGSNQYWGQFWIAAIPTIGLFVYAFLGITWGSIFEKDIGRVVGKGESHSGWHYFKERQPMAIARTLVFFIAILILLYFPIIKTMQNPGVIVFTIIVVLFGTYWIFEGVKATNVARSNARIITEPWPTTFQKSPYTMVGALMLRSFFFLAAASAIWALGNIVAKSIEG
jgi:hypothetical protein